MADKELSVEEKLLALYDLQVVMSNVDKIKTVRGELPLEVKDLEDDIAGLETRVKNFNQDIEDLQTEISNRNNKIGECNLLIAKYEEQQKNVRNNREYDSLSKEIEFNGLEIQLAEKHIREFSAKITKTEEQKAISVEKLDHRKQDLISKENELEEIISETQSEEGNLLEKAAGIETAIEPRLLTAFKRIRKNARNGLAVVSVERGACGGCFNKIPPQRQMDIKLHKKVIVCEYCGRILVDSEFGKTPEELAE